jgi:glycosyltransferase involved in cell wall biosynthesis
MTMPVFNEADGITIFLDELCEELEGHVDAILITDDSSTDGTSEVINSFLKKYSGRIKFELLKNEKNLGHGLTTVAGLRAGLARNADIIVAMDGDGQFRGSSIRTAINLFERNQPDVLEGVRTSRKDPFFRKVTTLIVRLLVITASRKQCKDGNTPFRIYSRSSLEKLLNLCVETATIPNVYFSIIARRKRLVIQTLKVESLVRRGVNPEGSTWKQKKSWLPSKRYISFCGKAAKQFLVFIWRGF